MQVFKVQGMSCGHCVRAVSAALLALDADAQVDVDLAGGEVRVESRLSAEQCWRRCARRATRRSRPERGSAAAGAQQPA